MWKDGNVSLLNAMARMGGVFGGEDDKTKIIGFKLFENLILAVTGRQRDMLFATLDAYCLICPKKQICTSTSLDILQVKPKMCPLYCKIIPQPSHS